MVQTDNSARRPSHKTIPSRATQSPKPPKRSARRTAVTDRILPPFVESQADDLPSPVLRQLRVERRRLLNEIQAIELPVQDHPTSVTHLADNASDVTEQMTAQALRHHLDELLKDVERAIARAEHGTYGVCERCGQPISAERLQALPATTLCLVCAQVRTHKATG